MKVHSLDGLADALNTAAPVFKDDRARQSAGTVYRSLAGGKPVSDAALAASTQLPIGEVRSMLASWPGVFRNDGDDIVGFWGLALSETPHLLDVHGVRLFGWCAWDTLFLPSILGADASVQSTDPSSGDRVRLTVTPDKVTELSHEGMVVSFLLPDAEFDDNVVTNFCNYVHFFTDPDSAVPWLASHDRTFSLDLDDAFQLGQRWNAARGL